MTQMPFPVGVRPLLFAEAAKRREVESSIVDALTRRQYEEVILPVVDFTTPYADVSTADEQRRSYRFTDREGELLSIRTDFTPMAARVLAPLLSELELPVRLFYRGEVIRCEPSRLGVDRELFQIGAELVGDDTLEADLEIIRLALDCVSTVIDPVFTISCCTDETLAAIRDAIPEIRFVASASRAEHPYYSGFRFNVFRGGAQALPVASGGRYDDLYARFGAGAPAVGFTLSVDLLGERP